MWAGMLRRKLDEPPPTREVAGAAGIRSNGFSREATPSKTASPTRGRTAAAAHRSVHPWPRGVDPKARAPQPHFAEAQRTGTSVHVLFRGDNSSLPVSNAMQILRLKLRNLGAHWKPPI